MDLLNKAIVGHKFCNNSHSELKGEKGLATLVAIILSSGI